MKTEAPTMRSRLLAGLAISALLITGAGSGSAGAAPDPAYPTGNFAWDHETKYLSEDLEYGEQDPYVQFTLRATALGDDVTSTHDLVVKVLEGTGSPTEHPVIWADPIGSFTIDYDHYGTFSPKVWITDGDHHTTVIDLPQLTVLRDNVAPIVTLIPPTPALEHRAVGWRVPHGTITDAGIGAAYSSVLVKVMQRRGARWYYWSERYPSHRWLKGKKTLAATRSFDDTGFYTYFRDGQPAGTWRTEPISGYRHGAVVVCYQGQDNNGNKAPEKCVTGRITRR